MILGFEHLEPLEGVAPSTFPQYGRDILYRARKLLSKRTSSEIVGISEIINWISSHDFISEHTFNHIIAESQAEELGVKAPEYPGHLQIAIYGINLFREKFNLPSNEIANLEWFEIYASLAITLLDQAIDDEKYFGTWQDHDEWAHEWRVHYHASTWIIEAMEAVSIAEGLYKLRIAEDESKQKISIRNTNAAIQRHSKTNAAILEVAKIFESGGYKSMRNAVQIYCENNPEKISHLAPYNRIRTLTDGLSLYLKGRRRSLESK